MKIAIFSDCYLDLTGGIRSSIDAQKAALEKLGHTVYIFTTSYPKSKQELEKLNRVQIFPVPSCFLCFRGLTPVSRRPKIIERWLMREHPEIKDFDIFYIHYEAGCSIAGLRLGKQFRIPTVQVMHGREDMGEGNIIPFGFRTIVAILLNWFHSWYLPHKMTVKRDNYLADNQAKAKMWTLMVNHANYADMVLTPSAHFREKLMHYGVKKEIKVFPNGIAEAHFPKNPSLKALEENETLRIIWHSRVSAEKRMMPFLHALKNVHGNYQLDVYGGGGDFIRAKRFALKNHLNVLFHGNTDYKTLANKLAKAHLDVLVSYNFDTFGMTLIEAEANGVPVFFCDPDMKEVVPKGSFIMSKNETPEAMAEALNELINHPEKIKQMSEIMLKHREEVLISNRIRELEKIFNGMIKV
ncbi:glycosyltransferase family 4 protein [Candidatus Saccharibacteria bacterium]|nr:glycosyltransferase family 4 protein [Candidatus Saccharibacteria bacterium]